MKASLWKEFANPGSEYRGAPFWAWNGKLEPEELRRQVRLMRRMGLGGFFMHSRVGLDTEYLSKDWFECVAACVDEAKKLKMRAWLYDEDRWPSGAAGGLVTKNPKYRMRSLVMDVWSDAKKFKWNKDMLAAFTAKVDEQTAANCASDVQRLARGKKPGALTKGQVILSFHVQLEQPSSWFNGQTYLDTMNPAAVREYLRVTHEAYRKNHGRDFGKTVPGIFTDEPHHGRLSGKTADGLHTNPWTDRLPAVFRKRYGYDILGLLPHLFYKVDGQPLSKIRLHYNDCITHMFVDAFARQVGEWCGRNRMMFTGHVLGEDFLSSQTGVVGNCMRFYEHMQAPGMDLLTEYWRIYDTAKQVSSVARQFGRQWRLSETYGCTGWDFPFVGHKALGDWQTALGINVRCQHLAWYTMLGQAKRDYPAGIFYQSPWWDLYPKVEDYFARVYAVMTKGTEVRDLLVIHPIESMWLLTYKNWKQASESSKQLDDMVVALRDSLLTAGIDFDYGDEELMSRHAAVVGGKGETLLRVGKATYKAVVVPPLKTIRSSTLAVLRKFRQRGGLVVFAGEPPAMVDGDASPAAAEFVAECIPAPAAGPELPGAVEGKARRVAVMDRDGAIIPSAVYLLREDADHFYLFVHNSGHTRDQLNRQMMKDARVRERTSGFDDVRIRGFAGCAGQPLLLDPETGAVSVAEHDRDGKGLILKTSLPPSGSRLFVVPKKADKTKYPAERRLREVRTEELKQDRWPITLSESNVLVLDKPSFRIGAGEWQTEGDVLKVDQAVRKAMGIPVRGGQMVQPWARVKNPKPRSEKVTLRYTFDADVRPTGDLHLAVEAPETFDITFNGVLLVPDMISGWWCDKSLRKLAVDPSLMRNGSNEVVLTCEYNENHPGFEIVYLLGDFGVRTDGAAVRLTGLPGSLELGDWAGQGFAFYSGSITYNVSSHVKIANGERLFVRIPDYRGVAFRVLVNGKSAGVVGWAPNELDITEFVGGESVELGIQILGHRRNSHGPLHLSEKWPAWTGPAEFISTGERWVDGYQLVPCGLMSAPRLVAKK